MKKSILLSLLLVAFLYPTGSRGEQRDANGCLTCQSGNCGQPYKDECPYGKESPPFNVMMADCRTGAPMGFHNGWCHCSEMNLCAEQEKPVRGLGYYSEPDAYYCGDKAPNLPLYKNGKRIK